MDAECSHIPYSHHYIVVVTDFGFWIFDFCVYLHCCV